MSDLHKPTDEELLGTLRILMNNDNAVFRPFQKNTIDRILEGNDILTVVPTGGGKSCCYQVSAKFLPGITLVISPLVALIEDQVITLKNIKFPDNESFHVACITSSFLADCHSDKLYYYRDKKNRDDDGETAASRKILDGILSDACEGKYKIIYITPERLNSPSFIKFAKKANISMIAVDEAHCVSLWGYEFRQHYLKIPLFLNEIGYRPIISAFTATATKSVREDIIKRLGMKNDGDLQKRDNLNFYVYDMSAKTPEAANRKKNDKLIEFLKNHREERGYIYCNTVEAVNKLYRRLKKENKRLKEEQEKELSFTRYYSELDEDTNDPDTEVKFESNENKTNNFSEFKSGEKKIMITTNALGMGIDVRDIRFVIHYNMPQCLENYYQEAGRAGRDKDKEADCILFYSQEDRQMCNRLINTAINRSDLSKSDKKLRRIVANNRLSKMVEYVRFGKGKENDPALQDFIIDYFNNYDPIDDKSYKNKIKEKEEIKASNLEKMDIQSDIEFPNILFSNRTLIAQELRKGRMSTKESPNKKVREENKEKKEEYRLVVGDKGKQIKKGKQENQSAENVKKTKKITVRYEVTGVTDRFTYFDMLVADAVYTLMFHGVPIIYARDIIRLLLGGKNNKIRPEKVKDIEKSIDKMRSAYIVIDMDGKKKGERKVTEGKFLPLEKKEDGGYGYGKGTVAPLYKYAENFSGEFRGQFFTFPSKLFRFDEKELKSMSSQKKIVETSEDDYMQRRIKIIKFYPMSSSKPTENKESKNKRKPQRKRISPQSEENLGTPENPLLPIRFKPTNENLALLHYLLCRIDMMPRLFENEKKSATHFTSDIIRFDTMAEMLNVDIGQGKVHSRRKADELWKWTVMILRHLQSVGYIEDYELILHGEQETKLVD
ncbi:MAG: ATP-dependent DNA helicase RecQ [Oscillospiraceae bacterium]|nr:ATP-dependent DNA helicase RecQ [Oscillospiraceae bacterium]